MNYHLIGIGGCGMSGLAQILVNEGYSVSGSDRNEKIELADNLKKAGVKIYGQDGSGINRKTDNVIISRAIENDNTDLVKARALGCREYFRQDMLKELFRAHSGIAVAGTSGKTTVVGMIACVLDSVGFELTVINGGIIKNYNNNIRIGSEPYYCIETDESECNLKGFYPKIGVLTNIGSDHMCRRELVKVYEDFLSEVKNTIVISSEMELEIGGQKKITFGIKNDADVMAADIELFPSHSVFKVNGVKVNLPLPGMYNVYNALAALATARAWGAPIDKTSKGLEEFRGIKRRFEIFESENGVRVIDDYAHNSDKIRGALQTAKIGSGRLIVIYQPHGYAPARMFFNELVRVFSETLDNKDALYMPEIFYAGGTAKKDISSNDIVKEVKAKNMDLDAEYFPKRDDIINKVCSTAASGDTVIIMGARDQSLTELGQLILKNVRSAV